MAPDGTCQGTRLDGSPCEAPDRLVDDETGFCPAHSPGGRERLSEAGKKGAAATAKKLRGQGLDPDDLPPLVSHEAAEVWEDRIGRAAATGRIPASAAQAGLRAVREWRETREAGKVSAKLEALDKAMQRWRETGDPKAVMDLLEEWRTGRRLRLVEGDE